MNFLCNFLVFMSILSVNFGAEDNSHLLENLFDEIKKALNAESDSQMRQQPYPYRPQNNGISLGVYEALRSIARNDELECVSRLLCEAAAGGQPGYSGKQIKFDKVSLTKLISYLKLDVGSSSPLLVFGRAALLGVSNRGDPYSCIINYPKCPKDQSRLLYYLNNHRGGFFQYFDNKYHKPGNYYYQNQYRPGYYYHNKRNKIQFEKPSGLYDKHKSSGSSGVYAKKYAHSSLTFPGQNYKRSTKPMVFPKGGDNGSIDPRIVSKPENFIFSEFNRFPKRLNELKFFPQGDQPTGPAAVATDRLPNRFYFPQDEGSYSTYPNRYSPNSFFPSS